MFVFFGDIQFINTLLTSNKIRFIVCDLANDIATISSATGKTCYLSITNLLANMNQYVIGSFLEGVFIF